MNKKLCLKPNYWNFGKREERKMAATSDEEMESLLSTFNQIYEVLQTLTNLQSSTINPNLLVLSLIFHEFALLI